MKTFLLALFALLFVASTDAKSGRKKAAPEEPVEVQARLLKSGSKSGSSKASKSSSFVAPPTPQALITSLVAADPELQTLLSLVAATPSVLAAANGPNPITLFAPTDQAFAELFNVLDGLGITLTAEEIEDVLLYHVLNGEFFADDFSSGVILAANGEVNVLDVDLPSITINGASNVVEANIDASNGVIHKIDSVLIPPAETIAGVVANSASPTFTALVDAVVATGLLDTLNDPNATFTVFAPTDDAFAALGDLSGLSTQQITDILLYHVVPGLFGTGDIEGLGLVPTVLGPQIQVVGGDQFNPQLVNLVDGFVNQRASNGIVHAIDQVLTIPGSAPINP